SSLDLQRPGRDAPLRVALYLGGRLSSSSRFSARGPPPPTPPPQGEGGKKAARCISLSAHLRNHQNSGVKIGGGLERQTRRAPLPLAGRGRGWGCSRRFMN